MLIERWYISAYDHRVELVTAALVEDSELTRESATQLAVHVPAVPMYRRGRFSGR